LLDAAGCADSKLGFPSRLLGIYQVDWRQIESPSVETGRHIEAACTESPSPEPPEFAPGDCSLTVAYGPSLVLVASNHPRSSCRSNTRENPQKQGDLRVRDQSDLPEAISGSINFESAMSTVPSLRLTLRLQDLSGQLPPSLERHCSLNVAYSGVDRTQTRSWNAPGSARVDDRAASVDNFVIKLRKKIEEDAAKPRHIITIYGTGYKLVV
jgi:hypothetical protein